MRSEQIKLFDIAECDLYNKDIKSKYKIPNIQRGLVWKSMQMELLWDSILRGFPIGSMLVLGKEGNGGDILDGQQRANAIISGFNKNEILGEKKPTNILWFDLNYKSSESDKERRKYGIRLTNASHPWGYDENGNKLSAKDRRDSLRKALGENYSQIKKSDWDIRLFVPYFFSKQTDFLPIPMAILVNAAKDKNISNSDSIKDFKETVTRDVKDFSKFSSQWKKLYEDKVLKFISNQADEEFFRTFFELNCYSIVFNFVDNNDDIEILFNRVNSRGTQMTNAELTYAAIKHYGAKMCNCPDIGQIIKEKSIGIMLEQNLAQLLFRYCFSDNNKISGEISASKIREKALLDEAKKDSDIVIVNLRKMFSEDSRTIDIIIKRIKEILLTSPDENCKLPNFLLAEIATKNPNLFILLFCIIEKQNHFEDRFVQALIFYLYCFSVNNEPVSVIFEKVSGGNKIKEETIIDVLRDSISREWCYPIISSFKDFPALNETELSDSWNIDKYSDAEGFSVFKLLFTYGTYQGLFMLKFAQRRFYKEFFGDYNPSNKEHWDEINRPWDHDHIIPKNWISNGVWKNCQEAWINSIGNIADIPYEENRSKSDEANLDFYTYITNCYNDYRMLYFDGDSELTKINRQSFEQGSGTIQFLLNTKKRFVNITNDFLSLFDILHIKDRLSPMQQARKKYLIYLQKEKLFDYSFYYRGSNGKEMLAKELDNKFWQKPWISLINNCGEKWHHAIAVYETREPYFKIERGERNLSMDSTSEIGWKEGTKFRRELPLFDGEEVHSAAKIFVDGANYYNLKNNINEGFKTDSSSFISFEISIEEVEIKAIVYTYYSYCYCSIRSINDGVKLPSKVLAYFNEEKGFKWRNDVSIDCLLLRRDAGIMKNCDAFSEIMVELYKLKDVK
ncbi:MAG: DUF262 domain-containing protein [Bacteroidaceae bacterium]|nr:DUF262 domain-containing protein [Bacteroidaceae bacterium]